VSDAPVAPSSPRVDAVRARDRSPDEEAHDENGRPLRRDSALQVLMTEEKRQRDPISRVLSPTGFPAGVMVIPLDGRLPGRSSGLTRGPRAGRPSPPLPGTRPPIRPCTGWGLPSRPGHPGRWCALTAPFHPYRAPEGAGGLFSVALSVRLPSLDVIQHPARRCPDFPPAPRGTGDHLAPSGADQSKSGELSYCTARTGSLPGWLRRGPPPESARRPSRRSSPWGRWCCPR
jgi:hypothetical protein